MAAAISQRRKLPGVKTWMTKFMHFSDRPRVLIAHALAFAFLRLANADAIALRHTFLSLRHI